MERFIIQKEEYKNKTIRMEAAKMERVSRVAQEFGVSVNNLINQCVDFALDNMMSEDAK